MKKKPKTKRCTAGNRDKLSYSELEAVEHIFEELDSDEGFKVASKIADQLGIPGL